MMTGGSSTALLADEVTTNEFGGGGGNGGLPAESASSAGGWRLAKVTVALVGLKGLWGGGNRLHPEVMLPGLLNWSCCKVVLMVGPTGSRRVSCATSLLVVSCQQLSIVTCATS